MSTATNTSSTTPTPNCVPENGEYYRIVDACASARSNQPISNALPEHARYLMTKMFQIASRKIRLYSGSLERSVASPYACEPGTKDNPGCAPVEVYAYKDLLVAVGGFLRKQDNELYIVVEKEVDGGIDAHPLVTMVNELSRDGTLLGKIEIKKLEKKLEENDSGVVENHFMVMDDAAYRYEFDHKPCRAQANFGDSATAKSLVELFDKYLFPAGIPVFAAPKS